MERGGLIPVPNDSRVQARDLLLRVALLEPGTPVHFASPFSAGGPSRLPLTRRAVFAVLFLAQVAIGLYILKLHPSKPVD
jgi:hypothetical protein